MKCMVAVKQVIDPYVAIRVNAAQTAVETTNVKMALNPFDAIAVEEAVRHKEAGVISEITAVSIGTPSCNETLRQALALGADTALLIATSAQLSPLNVAKTLATIAREIKPQIIIMGKQAIDNDCNQTGQMLAALLDWSQGTFCSKLVINAAQNTATVTREIDGGLEKLSLQLPTVITTDLRLNEPRYISLPNIMQAKHKPLQSKSLNAYSPSPSSTLQTIKVQPPPSRKTGIKVASAAELLQKLRNEAHVI